MTAAPKRVELVFEVPWTHPSWVLEDEKMPESALQDAVCDAIGNGFLRCLYLVLPQNFHGL